MVTRSKQKAENKAHEAEQSSPKKAKSEEENGRTSATKSAEASLAAEFEDFCKATRENLSIEQMKDILRTNEQDFTGPDYVIASKGQDMLFFGALEKCPVCNGTLVFDGKRYGCSGFDSEWSSCTFKTKNPPLLFSLVAEELSEFGSSFSEEFRKSRQTIFRNDDLALWSTV